MFLETFFATSINEWTDVRGRRRMHRPPRHVRRRVHYRPIPLTSIDSSIDVDRKVSTDVVHRRFPFKVNHYLAMLSMYLGRKHRKSCCWSLNSCTAAAATIVISRDVIRFSYTLTLVYMSTLLANVGFLVPWPHARYISISAARAHMIRKWSSVLYSAYMMRLQLSLR